MRLQDAKEAIDQGQRVRCSVFCPDSYAAKIVVKKHGFLYWVSAHFEWIGEETEIPASYFASTEWEDIVYKCNMSTPVGWKLCDDPLDLSGLPLV